MKINWSKIESVLADIFKVGTKIAAVAEPIVVASNPGIGAVYTLSVNTALQIEKDAEAAASQESTHAAKLAAIATAVTPHLTQSAAQAGVSAPTEEKIGAYAQTVVDGLNVLSAIHTN